MYYLHDLYILFIIVHTICFYVISSRYLFRTFININLNIATDIASFIYI